MQIKGLNILWHSGHHAFAEDVVLRRIVRPIEDLLREYGFHFSEKSPGTIRADAGISWGYLHHSVCCDFHVVIHWPHFDSDCIIVSLNKMEDANDAPFHWTRLPAIAKMKILDTDQASPCPLQWLKCELHKLGHFSRYDPKSNDILALFEASDNLLTLFEASETDKLNELFAGIEDQDIFHTFEDALLAAMDKRVWSIVKWVLVDKAARPSSGYTIPHMYALQAVADGQWEVAKALIEIHYDNNSCEVDHISDGASEECGDLVAEALESRMDSILRVYSMIKPFRQP